MPRYSPEFLEALRRAAPLADLIGGYIPLKRQGHEFSGLCPFHRERTPSFTVNEAKGFFHCFGCGAHGDAISFVMRMDSLDFPVAVERVIALAHLSPDQIERRRDVASKRATSRLKADDLGADAVARVDALRSARRTWKFGLPAAGTLIETFFQSRRIRIAPPPTLRFARDMDYWMKRDGAPPDERPISLGRFPCMVALVTDAMGRFLTVHRTYLRADGLDKAPVPKPRKVRGNFTGGAIRLGPPRPTIVLGEGIETVLSVMQACGAGAPGAAGISYWATISLDNLPKVGLPEICRSVVLLADMDSSDKAPLETRLAEATKRFRGEGRQVRIARPPAGMDFNDWLQRGTPPAVTGGDDAGGAAS